MGGDARSWTAAAVLLAVAGTPSEEAPAQGGPQDFQNRCAALAQGFAGSGFSSLDTIAYELHAMLAEAVRNTQPQLVRNMQPEPVRDAQPAPKRNARTRPAPKRTAKIKSARAPARRCEPALFIDGTAALA